MGGGATNTQEGEALRTRSRERKPFEEREVPEQTEKKGKKSTGSGSQSAARSQSPTVMKIDGPEQERSSVVARDPREVTDSKGEQRHRGELSEDFQRGSAERVPAGGFIMLGLARI